MLSRFLKSKASATVAGDATEMEPATDTSVHELAPPVCTSADQAAPLPSAQPEWAPIVVGTVHSRRERAILLIEALRAAGYDGKAMYEDDLRIMHERLCQERGWAMAPWFAICRELGPKGLDLRLKGKLRVQGSRLTMYVIREPAANVVALDTARRA
jgi:hypothetical protein